METEKNVINPDYRSESPEIANPEIQNSVEKVHHAQEILDGLENHIKTEYTSDEAVAEKLDSEVADAFSQNPSEFIDLADVELARPGDAPKTAVSVNDNASDKLLEQGLKDADVAGLDVAEITREIDNASKNEAETKEVTYSIEKDSDDFDRRIFSVGGRKIAFADNTSANFSDSDISVLPATVGGVLEIAQIISPKDSLKLQNIKDNLSGRKLGDEEYAILDMISASITPKDELKDTDPLLSTYVADGLMLVAKALNGDAKSLEEVRTRITWLIENQTNIADKPIERYSGTGKLTINEKVVDDLHLIKIQDDKSVPDDVLRKTDGMFLIRRTPYYDKESESAMDFVSPATSTMDSNDVVHRDTLHWSINNLTLPHGFGVRPDGEIIITPLASALKANGCPDNFSATDVIYMTNPEEHVKMPDSFSIKLVELQDDRIIEEDNNGNVLVKSSNYSPENLEKFLRDFADKNSGIPGSPSYASLVSKVLDYSASYCRRNIGDVNESEVRSQLLESGPYNAVATIVKYLRVPDVTKTVDEVLSESIMRIVVESKIIAGGGEVLTAEGSGAYIIDENKTARTIESIAKELGVPGGSHGQTSEAKLEIAVGNYISSDNSANSSEKIKLIQTISQAHPYKMLRNIVYRNALPVSIKPRVNTYYSSANSNDWV